MDVIYQSHPVIEVASNFFAGVPIILQYEDIPIIEAGRFVNAGFTIRFPVYLADGIKVAVVVGSQIHLTDAGEKVNLVAHHEDHLTAICLEGKPIMEMRRREAAALKTDAELYAPEGALIKVHGAGIGASVANVAVPMLGGMYVVGNRFSGCPVGIHVTSKGISFGGLMPKNQ